MSRKQHHRGSQKKEGNHSSDEEGNSVIWEEHRRYLDDLFFRNRDFIPRACQEYKDFWVFLGRYEAFQRKQTNERKGDNEESNKSSKLGLPLNYDKRYRINVSLLSKDITDAMKTSKKGGKSKHVHVGGGELTAADVARFRSILLFYIDFCQKQKFAKLFKLRTDQSNLPINQFRENIVDTVAENQVVIIAGDTGCGKSTQVPQYLLHAGYSQIACTQPRRIACISLAKRVGYETLNEYGSEVAYQIRFEGSKTRFTRILFLTEGVLLRQMTSDPSLSQYSVVVVDEVHERHVNGDFLLGILKSLLQSRADLKLILMSATININLFAGYFAGAPVIQVPGRLYPIEVRYTPHVEKAQEKRSRSERLDPSPYLKIMQLIDHKYPSTERGDLLIFLSGMSEISAVVEAAREYAQQTRRWIILPLHSTLSVEEQDKVFDVPPDAVRKCIVSTNIAETSITIDGVRFIVDSGKVKEMSYDPQCKMQRLQESWISQASAEQRKGRAGRTGPGVCFRLYSESDYHAFSQYATAEIHRVPLDSILLQMVALGIKRIRDYAFIEPPPASNIENSLYFLKQHGALTEEEGLTAVGQMLFQLPVDVVIGKMLLMGSVFHVTEPVLIVAASLSVQSPFTRRLDNDPDVAALRVPLESEHGDPFTLLNAFDEWLLVKSREGSSRKWCKRRALEEQRLYEVSKLKRQFEELLRESKLYEQTSRDKDEHEQDEESYKMRQLKRLKRDHRQASRRKKFLKFDEEEQSSGEEQPVNDIRDLEFKLTHDLDQLRAGSTARRRFTLRDVNLLKIILVSGLYPNLAIPDETNSWKRDSEQTFHTRAKQGLLLHPTGVFATRPEVLRPSELSSATSASASAQFSSSHQLLAFVSLLETNKPYLVNAMRVPALQTLFLFGQSLDTNSDLTRVVVDSWLEVCFRDGVTGQRTLSAVQQLRATWARLLEMRLNQDGKLTSETQGDRGNYLELVLARKLSEFLDSDITYSLKRLLTTETRYLYVGPDQQDANYEGIMSAIACLSRDSVSRDVGSRDFDTHPTKGGVRVNAYLTHGCLRSALMAEAASKAAPYIRKHWTCAKCGEKLLGTVLERLQHEEACDEHQSDGEVEAESTARVQESDQSASAHRAVDHLRKAFYCSVCQQEFSFTNIEILKHKRSHKSA